jgi:hypothetical protein
MLNPFRSFGLREHAARVVDEVAWLPVPANLVA